MILFIANLLVKFLGIDLTKAMKYAYILIVSIGIIIVLVLVLSVKSCFTKEVKIDQEAIEKINSANEKQRKAELEEVIQKNSDVIKTIDERNTLSEEQIENRQKEIDKKVAEADQKIQEAKNQGRNVSSAELECILVPENCQ